VTAKLPYGIYDALLDENLREALARHPELRAVLGKIDVEEQPTRYSAFVAQVVEQALREESDPASRLSICNRLIELISRGSERSHLEKRRLVDEQKSRLLEITPPNYGIQGVPRPHTSLTESSLFTGSPQEPQLAHELQKEMCSADAVDRSVSLSECQGLCALDHISEDRAGIFAEHHVRGLSDQQGTATLGISIDYRTTDRDWAELGSLRRARLHHSNICPRSEKAKRVCRSIHLSWQRRAR
jgi:hypothetical protein